MTERGPSEIRITRVYTRSGDKGETGLVGGGRVSKASKRVHAIGDVDELNAALGVVKESLTAHTAKLRDLIEFLQQELFDLGSEVATEPGAEYPGMWRASPTHIARLEELCDRYGDSLPELRSFILPGGSPLAAALHFARTVARRAERTLVSLREEPSAAQQQPISMEVISYVNRLSDLLFILARWALKAEGVEAPLWQQERDRKLPT
ncbi:MAG: cob(I)yrinic acid a,c-diamide adenosyltransferase [Bdellovibrionales bacterium]|nr:cob(I)yrinic acid a,c-diamide adenosyltransferase [Bdellovibrionales bacterium]